MSHELTDVAAIVAEVTAHCDALDEDPIALGLSLVQEPDTWHVAMEMDYPYAWPRGHGQVAYDTTRYPHASEAFRALLWAACQAARQSWTPDMVCEALVDALWANAVPPVHVHQIRGMAVRLWRVRADSPLFVAELDDGLGACHDWLFDIDPSDRDQVRAALDAKVRAASEGEPAF